MDLELRIEELFRTYAGKRRAALYLGSLNNSIAYSKAIEIPMSRGLCWPSLLHFLYQVLSYVCAVRRIDENILVSSFIYVKSL